MAELLNVLTPILSAATLAVSGWVLMQLIEIKVQIGRHAEQHDDVERRLVKLEDRAGI